MNAQGLIVHPANYYYVQFREDYLQVAHGCTYKNPAKKGKSRASAHCKALILDILEHWTDSKRGKGRSLWVAMTYQQFSEAMYGLFGRLTIMDSLDELVGEGLLERKPYQYHEKGLYQYSLNYQEVNRRLAALPKRNQEDLEPTAEYEDQAEEPPSQKGPGTASQMRQTESQMRRGQVSKETDRISNETRGVSFETHHRLHRLDTDSHKDSEREKSTNGPLGPLPPSEPTAPSSSENGSPVGGSTPSQPPTVTPQEDALSPSPANSSSSSEKKEPVQLIPKEPPDDAPWDAITCCALLDALRGFRYKLKEIREEEQRLAAELVQSTTRAEFAAGYKAMKADPFWKPKTLTMKLVAKHLPEYAASPQQNNQPEVIGPSKQSLGGPRCQIDPEAEDFKARNERNKAAARARAANLQVVRSA